MLGSHDGNWRRPIPIFPLPNCVLFPGAVIPLHLFEPRYIEMMQAVAAQEPSSRLMAMALLRDGWESYYHTRRAPIHPVVCVGRVIQHEERPDGCFNLLLLGLRRATIVVETGEETYRKALLSPVEPGSGGCDEGRVRELLYRTVVNLHHHTRALSQSMIERIFGSAPTIDVLVDVLAYHLVPGEQASFKQSLLEERRAEARAKQLLSHLRERLGEGAVQPETPWPPAAHLN